LQGGPLSDLLMGRYFITMMGFFAMYNGLVYNEWFSMPIEFFHSCYTQGIYSYNSSDPYSQVGYHRVAYDCVYEFGFDPRWQQSANYLNVSNSIKMKIAVILGVLQMSLGIVMKGLNAIHFSKPLDFLFEFIPQIVMLSVLFGWMDFLIIAKWCYPYNLQHTSLNQYNEIARAPSIITVMINMFLEPGTNPATQEPITMINIIGGATSLQTNLATAFVLVIFVCVPLMLCVKPCVWRCQHSGHQELDAHL
jgi:V-type H+-transporting ATPase subunit a